MTLKETLANRIAESMSAESESFANYLATKILREFNVSFKISEQPKTGFNQDDNTRT